LNDVFIDDARLKTLFVIEQTAFGNYFVALAGAAAFKNGQSNEQQRSAYAAMDKAATIYENLGSAADATAALMQPSTK
jgi:hypothetical protein